MSNCLINNYLAVFGNYAFVAISNIDSPYAVRDKDGIISIDTSTAPVVVVLPAISASAKKTYTIVDSTGDSNTNNITVNTTGGDTINQSASITLVNAFNSLTIVNNEATEWSIISASTNESQLPSFIGPTIYLEGTNAVDNAVSIVASNTLGGIELTPGTTGPGTNFTNGVFRFTSTSSSTGDDAIPVTTIIHTATSDGPGGGPGVQNTLTLADGQEGQKLHIIYVAEGHSDDDILIAPTNPRGYSSLNLIEVGDSVELLFQDSRWNVVGGFNTIVGSPTLSGPMVFIEGTAGVVNAVHIIASGAGGGILMDADTGGFDFNSDGGFTVDALLQLCLTSTQAVADAICIYADNTAGGIQMRAGATGIIDLNRGAITYSSILALTGADPGPVVIGLDDMTVEITTVAVTIGDINLFTLANGTDGQKITIKYKAESAAIETIKVTPATAAGYTDFILESIGSAVDLSYISPLGWYIVGSNGLTMGGGPPAANEAPQGYVNAKIRYVDDEKVTVGATGEITTVRDSTNVFDLILSGVHTLDIAGGGGPGSLQTASAEAADEFYQICIIGDTTGGNTTTVLLIPDGTAFSEVGYDVFRRVGWVRNNSSDFMKFFCTGLGNTKTYHYDEVKADLEVLDKGSSSPDTSYTDVDCTALVPPTAELATILIQFDSSLTASDVRMRPDDSAVGDTTTPYTHQIGLNSSSDSHAEITIPLIAGIFEYNTTSTSDRLNLYVLGYVDEVL